MPSQAQLLKAYGHALQVELPDLARSSVLDEPSELATLVLVGRTCGHPDVFDPEIAASDDPERLAAQLGMGVSQCGCLIEAHRRMGEYNNARWGKCYPDVTPGYSVRYILDRDTFPSHYKRPVTDDELNQIVEASVWNVTIEELRDVYGGKSMLDVAYSFIDKAYARVGVTHIEATDGPNGDHNVHVKSVPIPGSTIGIAWFPSGACDDHVNQHIDSTYQPGLMGTMKLGCHEFGHNHGEPHQFTGQGTHHSVMSYDPPRLFYGFSTGQSPHVLPKDASLDSLYEKYGGPLPEKPTTPIPTDPPVDPSSQPWAEGRDGYIRVHGPITDGQHADFNMTPRIKV